MEIIKKTISTIFYISIIFYLLSCASAGRSTRGLKPAQLNISYMPPYSGAVRLGISPNVETRISYWFETPAVDLYIHTANENNALNYGFTIGKLFSYEKEKRNSYFASLILGTGFKKRYYPYITYTQFTDFTKLKPSAWDLSFGCETVVYKNDSNSYEFVLTPELIIAPYFDGYPLNTPIVGTIGLGVSFDFKRIFQ